MTVILSSSSSSPPPPTLCSVFILILLWQTMSLGNTVLQLLLLFMVLISLLSVLNLIYFYISTFRPMCAVPNMAVFCSSLTSWLPGMLIMYFLNNFEIVPVAPLIIGVTFVFTFHMRFISSVRYYYYYYYYFTLIFDLTRWRLSRCSTTDFFFLRFFQYKASSQSVRPPACYTPYRPIRTSNSALICTLYMSMS